MAFHLYIASAASASPGEGETCYGFNPSTFSPPLFHFTACSLFIAKGEKRKKDPDQAHIWKRNQCDYEVNFIL